MAIAFAREGADVCIAYFDEDRDAEETMRWVKEAGREGAAFPGDLGGGWTPLIPSTRDEEAVEDFGADTFWGRPAQPAEIAPTFVFLASDDSRFVTGEVISISGRDQATR